MNKTIVFLLGLVIGILMIFILCKTKLITLDCGCKTDNSIVVLPPDQGKEISSQEFISMRDSFQNNLARLRAKAGLGNGTADTGSWGGRIGRVALQNLINSLPNNEPPDKQYIDFNFGLSVGLNPKTCVMFMAETTPKASYYISSGVPSSYCPPRCPVPQPVPQPQPAPQPGPVPGGG